MHRYRVSQPRERRRPYSCVNGWVKHVPSDREVPPTLDASDHRRAETGKGYCGESAAIKD